MYYFRVSLNVLAHLMNRSFILLLFLLFTSCTEKEGYRLTGNFNGLPLESLELRFFTFESTEVINTTITDSSGNFCFTGKVREPGLYGIKPHTSGDDQYITFFLENAPLTLSVDATDYNYKITNVSGNARAQQFEALQSQHRDMLKESEQFRTELEGMKSSLSGAEYQKRIDQFDSTFVFKLKQSIDKTDDPVHKVYLLSLLNLQEQFSYIKNAMSRIDSNKSKSIYIKQFNDKIAFANKFLSQYQPGKTQPE